MTIPASAQTKGIISPNPRIPIINLQGQQMGTQDGSQQGAGQLSTTGLQMLQQMFTAINGLTPTVACNATFAANVYTLTPAAISPNVPNYFDYWSFAFVAPATSTGLVTATIVPNTGTLPTLPVYKTNGSAQATTNDITVNLFYVLYFVDSFNNGNGGFCAK